jgi:hypothetical protein
MILRNEISCMASNTLKLRPEGHPSPSGRVSSQSSPHWATRAIGKGAKGGNMTELGFNWPLWRQAKPIRELPMCCGWKITVSAPRRRTCQGHDAVWQKRKRYYTSCTSCTNCSATSATLRIQTAWSWRGTFVDAVECGHSRQQPMFSIHSSV